MKLLLITLLIICNYSGFAQNETPGSASNQHKQKWSIFVSGNRTIYSDENSVGKYGYGGGFHFKLYDDKSLNVSTGLELNKTHLLINKKFDGHWSGIYDMDYDLFSLSIPFLLRKHLYKNLSIEAGFMINVNLGYKYSGYRHSGVCPPPGCGQEIEKITGTDGLEEADLLGRFGFQYEFHFNKLVPFININYSHGTTPLTGADDFDDNIDERVFNRYLQAAIGIKF